MPPENTSPRDPLLPYLRFLVACVLVSMVVGGIVSVLALQKLERIVTVSERLEQRANQVMDAAAPVGREAVAKSVETIKGVDAHDLAESATKGIKDLGNAAVERAKERLRQDQAPATQPE